MRRLSLLLLPVLLLGTAAAAQSLPTLTFNDAALDWSVVQSGPLVPGGQVKVIYDTDRLPGCRGDANDGGPGWAVTGYYQLNDGAVGSFYAGGRPSYPGQSPEAVLDLPEDGSLALWFQITNLWGCSEWDSNYGNNFRFDVGHPRIVFLGTWTHTVYGTLRKGGSVVVDYDISRLPHCRQTYNGLQTWNVEVQYRVDGGAVQTAPLTQVVDTYGREAVPAVLSLPATASWLEMWFHNWDRTSCHSWDSAYGQNYGFGVSP